MKTTCAYCGVGCGIRLSREGDNWQLQGMSSIRPTAAPCASRGQPAGEPGLSRPPALSALDGAAHRLGGRPWTPWRSALPPSWPSPGRMPSASICRAS